MSEIFNDLPSFLGIGHWTKQFILPLFDFFKNEDVAPALAFLIFCLALALCVLFLLDATYIRAQVRRRTRAVQRIKDELSFAQEMPRIDKLMLSSGYLRHSWQKFRETLIDPSEGDHPLNTVFRNTTRPQTYFNTAEAGLRFPLFRAMPNLLVGVGLLLTFFGLVAALYFTTDAIRTGDLAASQEALRKLLYAASFKFYTSIAGLGGSIILTLVLRYGTSKVEGSFDDLAFALERKLRFVTSESIAFDHLREAHEQTKNLKLFNTEVAISVGRSVESALSSTLPNYLAEAMAPIQKSLVEVVEKLTSMNEGAITNLASKFTEKLEGSTGEHMQSLASTLAELRDSLEQLSGRLADSGSGLVHNVTTSSQEMREVAESMTRTAQAMQEAGGPLEEHSRLIAEASRNMAEATQNAVNGIGSAEREIREVGQLLQTTLEATAQQWNDYETRFKGVDESLESVLNQITQQVQTSLDALRGFIEKIDEKLAGAVDRLGGGIDDLTEFARTMEHVTTKLNGGNNPHKTL
jgi:ABC-type transporter Mla subunit MlaD